MLHTFGETLRVRQNQPIAISLSHTREEQLDYGEDQPQEGDC